MIIEDAFKNREGKETSDKKRQKRGSGSRKNPIKRELKGNTRHAAMSCIITWVQGKIPLRGN